MVRCSFAALAVLAAALAVPGAGSAGPPEDGAGLRIRGASRVPRDRIARLIIGETPKGASIEWDVYPPGQADIEEAGPLALVTAPPGRYLIRVRVQWLESGRIATQRATQELVVEDRRELVGACDDGAAALEAPVPMERVEDVQFLRRRRTFAADRPAYYSQPAPSTYCAPPTSTYSAEPRLRLTLEQRDFAPRRPLLIRVLGGEPARRETTIRLESRFP